MSTISELINGQAVQGTYLIRNATVRTGRQGRDYLELTLSDQTGEISARLWECTTEQKETFVTGKVVGLTGRVQEWQGKRQLIVERIWLEQSPPALLVKGPPLEEDVLWYAVISRVEEIGNTQIRTLLSAILTDHREQFLRWPAAKGMHHAIRGGLIYHVVTMLKLADRMLEVYPFLNRDLLYAGIILHDISKILEMDADELGIVRDYTTEGKMFGHIVQGIRLVDRYAVRLGLDEEKNMLLQHMILSHHYNPEWGSPKPPMIPEAEILHYLDMIDARMYAINEALSKESGDFTEPTRSMEGRRMYVGAG